MSPPVTLQPFRTVASTPDARLSQRRKSGDAGHLRRPESVSPSSRILRLNVCLTLSSAVFSGTLRDYLGPRTSYELFHNDQTWEEHPPSLSFMWALELPSGGASLSHRPAAKPPRLTTSPHRWRRHRLHLASGCLQRPLSGFRGNPRRPPARTLVAAARKDGAARS